MTREQHDRRARLAGAICLFHGLPGSRELRFHVERVADTIESKPDPLERHLLDRARRTLGKQ